MVAFPRFQGLTGSIPTTGAGIAAVIGAGAFALMPDALLESLVWTSGITALVPAAEPPLATTARAILAIAGGVGAAAVAWAALYLVWGPGGWLAPRGDHTSDVPVVRRADAHPDAPPRRPMSAADLGTPLMEVAAAQPRPAPQVERTIPVDLDTPLASFDPAAIPAATIRPLPGAPSLAPGERMDAFELTPVVRFGSEAPVRTEGTFSRPTLDQLIRRLEQGAQRRAVRG
jgi:hypothetical protein